MKIEELITAKEMFFRNLNINDDNSRKRPLVYARTAFTAVFYQAGVSKLGAVFGRDHSSVVHYKKMHSTLKGYDDYKMMYQSALEFRKALMSGDELPMMSHKDLISTIQELRAEIQKLKKENEHLYIYKEKFFKLKELL